MLNNKLLWQAFKVNACVTSIHCVVKHVFRSDADLLASTFFNLVMAYYLLSGLFEKNIPGHRLAYQLGIITYYIISFWIMFPIDVKYMDITDMIAVICFPLLLLALSFYFFRKGQLEAAKGICFILICSFTSATILLLSNLIFNPMHLYLMNY